MSPGLLNCSIPEIHLRLQIEILITVVEAALGLENEKSDMRLIDAWEKAVPNRFDNEVTRLPEMERVRQNQAILVEPVVVARECSHNVSLVIELPSTTALLVQAHVSQ